MRKNLFLVFAMILSCGFSQTEKIGFSKLKNALENLLGPLKPCDNIRSAIISDKSSYRTEETAYITVLLYDFMTKQPITSCEISQPLRIEIMHNKMTKTPTVRNTSDKQSMSGRRKSDSYLFNFKWKIPKDVAEGTYFLRVSSYGRDSMKVNVIRAESPKEMIQDQWSQRSVKSGDNLKAKLTLKGLSRNSIDFKSISLSYKFSSNDQVLQESFKYFESETMEIVFRVPEQIDKVLSFSAVVKLNQEVMEYKKDFPEVNIEDIIMDFTIGTGKLVIGPSNHIFFTSWENKDRNTEMPITEGQVIKKVGEKSEEILTGVRSQIQGKGKFDLVVSDEDFKTKSKYFFEVKYTSKASKQYLIVDLADETPSPIFLNTKRIYYDTESLDISLNFEDYQGRVLLALINKGQIVIESVFNLSPDVSMDEDLNLFKSELSAGGVFTLALFIPIETENKTKSSKREYQNKYQYLGQLIQESEIFVIPSKTTSALISSSTKKSANQLEVEYSIKLNTSCERCLQLGGNINEKQFRVVVDILERSSVSEFDIANESSSLFSKIYFENEIIDNNFSASSSNKFLDIFFNSKRMTYMNLEELELRLDLLFGNQHFRKFLFDPNVLEDYLKIDKKEIKFDQSKSKLQKLLYSTDYYCSTVRSDSCRYRSNDSHSDWIKKMRPRYLRIAFTSRITNNSNTPFFRQKILQRGNPSREVETTKVRKRFEPFPLSKKASTETKPKETPPKIFELDNESTHHRVFPRFVNGEVKGTVKFLGAISKYMIRVYIVHESGVYGYTESSIN